MAKNVATNQTWRTGLGNGFGHGRSDPKA